jgi:hypothetical protein
MPSTEAQKNAQRAREIFESAQAGLIVNLGVTAKDAAAILLREAAKVLTPTAVKAALKA